MARKILIIDDEQSYLELTKVMLEREGYGVVVAESGEEGIKKAEEEAPDLIFLDIMMPGMSGMETLHALRNNSRTRAIPVIMATAKGDTQTMLETERAGAADYIIKPYDAKELLDIISIY